MLIMYFICVIYFQMNYINTTLNYYYTNYMNNILIELRSQLFNKAQR